MTSGMATGRTIRSGREIRLCSFQNSDWKPGVDGKIVLLICSRARNELTRRNFEDFSLRVKFSELELLKDFSK
jgi:hypothetical protein